MVDGASDDERRSAHAAEQDERGAETAGSAPASALSQLTIPADRCYWAVLPAACARLSLQARAYRAENVLPEPVEDLQLASVKLDDGRVLVCGISRTSLQDELAQVDAPVASAVPAAPPSHLAEHVSAAQLARCNFLYGAFEPHGHRRRRRLAGLALAVALLLGLGFGWWGVERRVAHYHQATQAHRQASQQVYASAFTDRPPQGLHPALAVEQELRRLRAVGQADTSGLQHCTPVMEAIWRVWPARLRVQIDTLTAGPGRVVLRGRAPSMAEANTFTQALRRAAVPDQDWRLAAPELVQEEDAVRFLCRLERQQETP